MTMRDKAVALATKGLHVFRLRPGTKDPYGNSDHHSDKLVGINIPSRDPEIVRKMWTDKGGNSRVCNIGVDTTKGLIVFDLDVKDGRRGDLDWAKAEAELGANPVGYGVITPSGGYHFYYAVPASVSAHKVFGKGIDIRGHHGYVVGEGSVVGGKEYTALPFSDDIPLLPASWLSRTQAPRDRAESQVAVVELDLPDNVAAAVALLQALPVPEIGEGNDTVFKVVCRVKDLGVSEGACLELVLEHFHSRMPGMPIAMVKKTVRSSYIGNSQNQPGVSTPEHEFGDVDLRALPSPVEPLKQLPKPKGCFVWIDTKRDRAKHPLRPWAMKDILLRRTLSVLTAPGAAGKSTLTVLWSIALALARSDLVGTDIPKPCRIGIINHEDDEDEFYRRLDAACLGHSIDIDDLEGKIAFYRGPRIIIADHKGQTLVKTPDAVHLNAFLSEYGLDVLFVDPFVKTHRGIENDNGEMDFVAQLYIDIAKARHAAVCVVHHSSKPNQASSDGHSTSQHASRGASAIINAARTAFNFFPMSEKDAVANNVSPDQRHKYARLDGVKQNYSLGTGQPAWFERVSVLCPNGEHVGTLKLASFETRKNVEVNTFIDAIVAMDFDFMNAPGGKEADVLAKLCCDPMFAGKSEDDLKSRLRKLFKGIKNEDGGFTGGQTLEGRTVAVMNVGNRKDYDWRFRVSVASVDGGGDEETDLPDDDC